ncbi:MAG: DUF1538 domain-containing protein [Flavonifractor sp.]|nr:DUF1538 domain-containing protein [Flavonifractor sp.]
MQKKLKEKISESLTSVLPVTVIVLLLSFTLAPMPTGTLMLFLLGAAMLIVGMGFFSLGADMAMMPIGEQMGGKLGGGWRLASVALICFLIGTVVTIAEPDLQVLAKQVPSVPDAVIILSVAAGVGLFLVVSMLRTRFGLPLAPTLVGLYALVFGLSIFVPNEFLAVAFDAGGVTTGPITVPFLMALGSGMAGVQGKDGDNFGMVALCSVGPILMVMLLGVCYQSTEIAYTPFAIPFVRDSQEVGQQFLQGLPAYMKEVALGLLPILVFFAVFQLASIRLKRRSVIKILVGAGYTYIGLVLFLTGANVGFMPAGSFLGRTLAGLPEYWLLVPIGMVVGWFIVAAEPAVHVLNRQVEDVTSGAIPQRAIGLAMSVGVSVSIGLAMLRVCLGIPIYFLVVPGYGLALLLTRFVPNMFTAIAFDSGGVASGPMTATFLLPLTMGACEALGRDILTDAFGVVAMVAMTPLITIQLLGLLYQHKLRRTAAGEVQIQTLELVSDIIDYDEEVER